MAPKSLNRALLSVFTERFLKARAHCDRRSTEGALAPSRITSSPPTRAISCSFLSLTARFANAATASTRTPTWGDRASSTNGMMPFSSATLSLFRTLTLMFARAFAACLCTWISPWHASNAINTGIAPSSASFIWFCASTDRLAKACAASRRTSASLERVSGTNNLRPPKFTICTCLSAFTAAFASFSATSLWRVGSALSAYAINRVKCNSSCLIYSPSSSSSDASFSS